MRLEIVKYTSLDPSTFLADAAQSQIEKKIGHENILYQQTKDGENIQEQPKIKYTEEELHIESPLSIPTGEFEYTF